MRILILLFVLLLSACAPTSSGSQDPTTFLPQEICDETGGSWTKVDATAVKVDSDKGVFDPDRHPDYNYQCVCPGGQSWSNTGCL